MWKQKHLQEHNKGKKILRRIKSLEITNLSKKKPKITGVRDILLLKPIVLIQILDVTTEKKPKNWDKNGIREKNSRKICRSFPNIRANKRRNL